MHELILCLFKAKVVIFSINIWYLFRKSIHLVNFKNFKKWLGLSFVKLSAFITFFEVLAKLLFHFFKVFLLVFSEHIIISVFIHARNNSFFLNDGVYFWLAGFVKNLFGFFIGFVDENYLLIHGALVKVLDHFFRKYLVFCESCPT